MTLLKRIQQCGPGLLWAGAAIGVSHLIQSTRAGAVFGLGLVPMIILALVMKYPFFEMGMRYASATHESLLMGYKRLHRGVLLVFILLTVSTMFTIQGAITLVTAGITTQVLSVSLSPVSISIWILVISTLILSIGKYSLLDRVMKWIVMGLSIATIGAVGIALWTLPIPGLPPLSVLWAGTSIPFIIALMGWMPAPLDISVWSSVWSVDKQKTCASTIPFKTAKFDFDFGYYVTAFLALCFVLLGAVVMFPSGETVAESGVAFSAQLVRLYTELLGDWARPFVVVAAFSAMFSTCLTCLDAFGRVLSKSIHTWRYDESHVTQKAKSYWVSIAVVGLGSVGLILFFKHSMLMLVDVATIISFVSAPFLAVMNMMVMRLSIIPKHYRLSKVRMGHAVMGLVYLVVFNIVYCVSLCRS